MTTLRTRTIMQFEYDPDRLIEEVKKRPGIWDYSDVNYRTMVTRHELWNEVVRELLEPSIKVTKSELRELVFQLQKKWKSMKDSFQKYVQNPHRSKRPYVYYKQLNFLLKNLTSAGIDANIIAGSSESEEDRKRKKRSSWKKKEIQIIKDEDQSSDDDNDQFEETPVVYSNDESDNLPLKRPKTSKAPDEFAFASVDTKSLEGEDTDKMFLMSLLPHLKTIPEESRLNVKMELMQVLQNANYKHHGRVISDAIS